LYDWDRLERLGATCATYAVEFRDRALAAFEDDGIDVNDAAQVLLALRRISMPELEQRVDVDAPPDIAALEPWKAAQFRRLSTSLRGSQIRLDGVRVVLAVLEVHDLVHDTLARALPECGAEVVVLGSDTTIDGVVRAATDEDADAIVISVYNGNALAVGEGLVEAATSVRWHGQIYVGGILNQDTGGGLPVDVRPNLEALGICCVSRVEDLLSLLATLRSR
jgi:methylmalonyl-CoA mutase cobalamin-binding subunit